MISAVLTVAALTLAGAGLLIWATRSLTANTDPLVDATDQALPQSQCAKCGYPGCRPYAQAVASGAPINRCPPGGEALIETLADLLGQEVTRLDPALAPETTQLAFIDESRCIGCALCLPACPVDAIVGAPRFMHTVISDVCTGCELCLPPCPVDCITIEAHPHETQPVRLAAPPRTGLACIHCGECVDPCPKNLRPDTLHRLLLQRNWNGLKEADLDACIVCGACNTACPSQLPLAEQFRWGRAEQLRQRQATERAQRARTRHAAHAARELARTSTSTTQRADRQRRISARKGGAWSNDG
jgi:electron transport complex protein RnfB